MLLFDKRASDPGVHGLSIKPPGLPEFNLSAGLRIEPSETLLDVGALFNLLPSYPLTITLWDTSKESIAKRQCPIFDMELGTSLNRTLGVEALHCFNLGIYVAIGGNVVWSSLRMVCGLWQGRSRSESKHHWFMLKVVCPRLRKRTPRETYRPI